MMVGRCPTCKTEVTEKLSGIWPFCSERCKLVDLGRWASEEYRVAGRPEALEDGAAQSPGLYDDPDDV